MNNQPMNARSRRQIAIPMGTGIALGLAFGAAISNIALGLVAGIVVGGLGAMWRIKKG